MATRLTNLAVVAFALIAVGAATPASAADVDLGKLQSLAQGIARNEAQVTAAVLNGWIVADRRDFVLVDVRSPEAYAAGHIKGARNLPLTRLMTAQTLATLRGARTVVLYSDAGDYAAQGAVLLRLAGLPAVSLMGGFAYWAEHEMNLPAATGGNAESLDQARRASMIRALNNCPPLPAAKIPPLLPAAAAPPPAPAEPQRPGQGPPSGKGPAEGGPKPDVPIILQGGCG